MIVSWIRRNNTMTLNPIAALEKLINEHGSAVILEKRLALKDDQSAILIEKNTSLAISLAEAVKKNNTLESEKSALQSNVAKLRQQLQDLQPTGFVEHMGAMWRRTNDGFEPIPYCKHCIGNPIMGRPRGQRFYLCGTGEHQAPLSIHPPTNEEG